MEKVIEKTKELLEKYNIKESDVIREDHNFHIVLEAVAKKGKAVFAQYSDYDFMLKTLSKKVVVAMVNKLTRTLAINAVNNPSQVDPFLKELKETLKGIELTEEEKEKLAALKAHIEARKAAAKK